METGFAIILITLVILIYVSNRRNKINRCFVFAGILFWLGIINEVILNNIIPWLESSYGLSGLPRLYLPVYSLLSWAHFNLAMPAAIVSALCFSNFEEDYARHIKWVKFAVYLPAFILMFFYPPYIFANFKIGDITFWTVYAIYNTILCAIFSYLMITGVQLTGGRLKEQKAQIVWVLLPPIIFWTISVFPVRVFQMESLYKLWHGNIIIVLMCVVMFIFLAFRDGFMGLKLSGDYFAWNTNLFSTKMDTDYTGHIIKNQTAKMELCVNYLKENYPEAEAPEELAILARSISTLQTYVERIKRHLQTINLVEERCRLIHLISEAMPVSLKDNPNISVNIEVGKDVFWLCDKRHMTEVLANILTNAVEAIRENGVIDIIGAYDKFGYLLLINDNGFGLDEDMVGEMFTPYFTTKNTPTNFGIGLTYCKNVITKHGGNIMATSKRGKGTAFIIEIPLKRLVAGTGEDKAGLFNG